MHVFGPSLDNCTQIRGAKSNFGGAFFTGGDIKFCYRQREPSKQGQLEFGQVSLVGLLWTVTPSGCSLAVLSGA